MTNRLPNRRLDMWAVGKLAFDGLRSEVKHLAHRCLAPRPAGGDRCEQVVVEKREDLLLGLELGHRFELGLGDLVPQDALT